MNIIHSCKDEIRKELHMNMRPVPCPPGASSSGTCGTGSGIEVKASDLHSAGCSRCQEDPSGKRLGRRSAGLLPRRRSLRPVHHPRLLPQKSEAVPQIPRFTDGLRPNRFDDAP